VNQMQSNASTHESSRWARLSEWLFIFLPIFLILGSITPPTMQNWFPTTIIFEVIFFGTVALSTLLLPHGRFKWIWFGLLFWVAYRLLASNLADYPAPGDEFFRAHKWIFYSIALVSALKFRIIEANKLNLLVNSLLVASAIKYSYSVVAVGFSARPGLFTENNFELFLLFGLVIVVYERGYQKNFWFFSTLMLVVFLSGSRSGATGLLVLLLYIATRSQIRTKLIQYLILLSVSFGAVVALLIFQARGINLETIDRINFLSRFLIETSSWSISEWLFGAPPLTQMSYETCGYLSFYGTLLSSAGDGTCYSVILHSQILRLVFDFGLAGLILCFGLLYFILRSSGMTWQPALALFALALTNSFSVSGPNNVYVVLPILAALITKNDPVRYGRLGRHNSDQVVRLKKSG
jgi:hypothetical protein